MGRIIALIVIILFALLAQAWAAGSPDLGAPEGSTSTPQASSPTVKDDQGNTATYNPPCEQSYGQIEYRYLYRDIWHTTYVGISEKKEKEILDKARKGETIPKKYIPIAEYYRQKGVLVGNSQVGDPIKDGSRFVEGWRVLVALGRQEDRMIKAVKADGDKTRKLVQDNEFKTKKIIMKEEKETRGVVKTEAGEIKTGQRNLFCFIFFTGCLFTAIIIARR